VSYLLSTCGSTEPSEKMYMSYFEDDFGNVGSKEVSRPKLAHLIYDYLPLIDEHKKTKAKKILDRSTSGQQGIVGSGS
jgi:hypothetical protein